MPSRTFNISNEKEWNKFVKDVTSDNLTTIRIVGERQIIGKIKSWEPSTHISINKFEAYWMKNESS